MAKDIRIEQYDGITMVSLDQSSHSLFEAPANQMQLALGRPPSKPSAQPDEVTPRLIYYPVDGACEATEHRPVPPCSLGSHAGKLISILRQGHEDVNLSQEDFVRLVAWVDANASHYGSYFGRRNLKYRHRLRPVPTLEAASGIPPLDRDRRCEQTICRTFFT